MRAVVLRVILLIATALLPISPAAAEPKFDLGRELPPIYLRVCWNLAAAVAQARPSAAHARLRGDYAEDRKYEHRDCDVLHGVIKPLRAESNIGPFIGWAPVYNEAGADSIDSYFDGRSHKIRFDIRRMELRYYRSVVAYKGKVKVAWVELSDEPYVLNYLADRGRMQ
jgi:hypothetical protein